MTTPEDAGRRNAPTESAVGEFYVHATRAALDDRGRVLKHGETFALFDRYGDVHPQGLGEQGLFHEGTRHLSRFLLLLEGHRPLLLSSNVVDDNVQLAVDLANQDLERNGTVVVPRGTIHLFRSVHLHESFCQTRLRLQNFGSEAVDLHLALEVEADFRDIFEIRGTKRAHRGTLRPPGCRHDELVLGYGGLDGVERRTRLRFTPTPTALGSGVVRYRVRLAPGEQQVLTLSISCETGAEHPSMPPYDVSLDKASRTLSDLRQRECRVRCSEGIFSHWLSRSVSDLRMLLTETPSGLVPYAGVPWYSTVFGRDAIITALETLWLLPEVAKGTLRFLASTQAEVRADERDAEPGKIVHELRRGEMAALGEIPFGRYYGSVDGTPLFVVLAGRYYKTTGDRTLVEELWPHVERALRWVETDGDLAGDGFLAYGRRASSGLRSQGWKDSFDAVFHADGRLAEPSIALCEAQGYAYAARREGARLARVLGHEARADELERQAEALRQRFEEAFWSESLGTYVLALDGQRRPCVVRTSNAGHCLWAGIARPDRAARVLEQLASDRFFTGWGVRTVADGEARFNPMSYHNGSVWPHDNALIALGAARYGHRAFARRILEALRDASRTFEQARIPELFCGFVRREGEGPTLYPVACSPQAWSAGTVLMLLQACLGLDVDATKQRVRLIRPDLPEAVDELYFDNLRIGESRVDLHVYRSREGASVNRVRREGKAEVVVVK